MSYLCEDLGVYWAKVPPKELSHFQAPLSQVGHPGSVWDKAYSACKYHCTELRLGYQYKRTLKLHPLARVYNEDIESIRYKVITDRWRRQKQQSIHTLVNKKAKVQPQLKCITLGSYKHIVSMQSPGSMNASAFWRWFPWDSQTSLIKSTKRDSLFWLLS